MGFAGEGTGFFEAVAAGDLPRLRELLAATPSLIGARDGEGATALHLAALHGNQELARFLVERGADVNARDERFHATPAGWAIEYLRGLGGFLGTEIEDTVLAIQKGDTEWVRRFLARHPRLAGCRDRSGKPLLEHAEESGTREIAQLLREAMTRSGRE
jgi:ankyrin repeat protein